MYEAIDILRILEINVGKKMINIYWPWDEHRGFITRVYVDIKSAYYRAEATTVLVQLFAIQNFRNSNNKGLSKVEVFSILK